MSYLNKSVILTNKVKGVTYGIAVLDLETNNGGVFGSLTSHDYHTDDLVLGISQSGKEVVKLPAVFGADNVFNFRLPNNFDINDSIGAVLVKMENGKAIPIVWGANGNKASVREDIIKNIEGQDDAPLQREVESTKSDVETLQNQMHLFEQDDAIDELIDNAVDDALEDNNDFYALIKPQLDQLFDNYDHSDDLENLIPDSQWVKVDYEGEGREYVVGKIFDNGQLKYICYGVPGSADINPPDKLLKYSQWLPLDASNELGYWIMYQDAITGEAKEVG